MPSFQSDGHEVKYATERRLLKFANKLRAAGDADPIDALMPSQPTEPKACLIANAVNFRSAVSPIDGFWPNGDWHWHMTLPHNVSNERVAEIAKAVGCRTVTTDYRAEKVLDAEAAKRTLAAGRKVRLVILLPKDIGNAARAFDLHVGWTTKYDKTDEEN